MTTITTTLTLTDRARAAYRQRKDDAARKLAAQHERDRKQCRVALAEILELPIDGIAVVDGPGRQWDANHPPFPFEATVDGLRFVFQVSGEPRARSITVHLVPSKGMPNVEPKMLDAPLDHYSRDITCLADLGAHLERFEPDYL